MARSKAVIYGPDGQAIPRRALTREVAAPELAGIRTLWHDAVAPGLTPHRLASILRAAENGDHREYLTLAEDMEERELHYNAVLSTRKRALTGLAPVVEAAGEGAKERKVADAVEELAADPAFGDLVEHLVDAIGKGYAVSEIMWETSASQWRPVEYRARDPRFFTFMQVERDVLRLASLSDPINGDPLPPYKFVRHLPRLKSGIPIRGGLAKPAAWAFVFKAYTLKDWVAFAETYGMPIRLGKYGPMATDDDRRKLLDAVRNIGTDAAGIIPDTMSVEFVENRGGTSGAAVFSMLADYLDKQLSKLVLGQTMTTDNGSSMAQAKVHENVRHDIKVSDVNALEITINRDLVRPFVDLNFGPQKSYPRIRLPIPVPEDLTALANNLKVLVPLGLRVAEQDVRERFGFSEPADGATLLGSLTVDAEADGEDDAEEEVAPPPLRKKGRPRASNKPAPLKARTKPCPSCGIAHNRADRDQVDDVAARGLDEWERVADPMLKPLRDLVRRAATYDDFLAGLPKAMTKMDAGRLVETLAASMAVARGLGNAAGGGARA